MRMDDGLGIFRVRLTDSNGTDLGPGKRCPSPTHTIPVPKETRRPTAHLARTLVV